MKMFISHLRTTRSGRIAHQPPSKRAKHSNKRELFEEANTDTESQRKIVSFATPIVDLESEEFNDSLQQPSTENSALSDASLLTDTSPATDSGGFITCCNRWFQMAEW